MFDFHLIDLAIYVVQLCDTFEIPYFPELQEFSGCHEIYSPSIYPKPNDRVNSPAPFNTFNTSNTITPIRIVANIILSYSVSFSFSHIFLVGVFISYMYRYIYLKLPTAISESMHDRLFLYS